MNAPRDRYERAREYDDQPKIAFPHSGAAQPVAAVIPKFTPEPVLPSDEERKAGKEGIAAARDALKRAKPPRRSE